MRSLHLPSSSPTTRRQFLGHLGIVAACIGSAHAADKRPEPVNRIVDTHQHLWDLQKLRLPWLQAADQSLRRSHVMADYLVAAKGLNIVRSVYMEVDVAPDCKLAEAEYVLDICRRGNTPMAAAVIGGNPAADDFRQFITRFRDSPHIKGVRSIVAGPAMFEDPAFRPGVTLLGDLGMSFDLCHSPQLLPLATSLVDACPATRFVLDHCGNADVKWFTSQARDQADARERWRRDLATLAKRQNVVCKISGIVASAPKDHWSAADLAPIVNHCLDVFGPDRVMFGGDWPVCTRVATLAQWVAALRQIVGVRSEAEQQKLFHDNAMRFYRLGAM